MGSQEGGNISIISYNDGSVIATLPLAQGDVPMMSIYNDKVLVLQEQGSKARFMQIPTGESKQANMLRSPCFHLDQVSGGGQ